MPRDPVMEIAQTEPDYIKTGERFQSLFGRDSPPEFPPVGDGVIRRESPF
jgi:hypothetical protein